MRRRRRREQSVASSGANRSFTAVAPARRDRGHINWWLASQPANRPIDHPVGSGQLFELPVAPSLAGGPASSRAGQPATSDTLAVLGFSSASRRKNWFPPSGRNPSWRDDDDDNTRRRQRAASRKQRHLRPTVAGPSTLLVANGDLLASEAQKPRHMLLFPPLLPPLLAALWPYRARTHLRA